ncbi:GGDEF domain-containing protein [Celerinatantimonas yamalensis]|uniref:diguanylate cyclase n=1 Tax=Celerinatantimonas yamalensis TaxID=559956 RepID=A0ABW9G9Q9_9GAMM
MDTILTAQILVTIYFCFYQIKPHESARKLWGILFIFFALTLTFRTIAFITPLDNLDLFSNSLSNIILTIIQIVYLFSSSVFIPLIAAQWYQEKLQFYAFHDQMTGLYNRYAMDQYTTELFKSQSDDSQTVLALIDMDHFKQINDQYGHLIGDKVLRLVAGLISSNSRDEDLVSRYGGEEFLIYLPNKNLTQGLQWANRMCQVINQAPIKVTDTHISISISIGIRHFDKQNRLSLQELIHQADIALYQAKNDGRNCVRIYQK